MISKQHVLFNTIWQYISQLRLYNSKFDILHAVVTISQLRLFSELRLFNTIWQNIWQLWLSQLWLYILQLWFLINAISNLAVATFYLKIVSLDLTIVTSLVSIAVFS